MTDNEPKATEFNPNEPANTDIVASEAAGVEQEKAVSVQETEHGLSSDILHMDESGTQNIESTAEQIENEAPVESDPPAHAIDKVEFPKDTLNTALHSDQVVSNYTDRANELIEWLYGKNSVDAITELFRAYNYEQSEKWKLHLEPDAFSADIDEGVRLFLVKRALHLSFLSVESEDITNVLMAVNAPDTGHVWFAMFERQVLPVMIRLGL